MSVEDEILELAEDMVKFRSSKNHPGEIEKNLQYIEEYFAGDEFLVERYESEGKTSLVVSFEDTLEPEVMLHGHIDIVEAPEQMFEPELRDGKLYGRGAGDMKSGVAALMKLVKDMAGWEDRPSVALVIVSDEELGGFNGMGHLVDLGYRPNFAISAEPNNMEGYMDIVIKQKGVLQLKVSAEGASAHGSRPWKGENAIEKLIDGYREIDSLFTDSEGRWVSTLNLGTIEGGDAVNKVPDHAEMDLDIRFASEYVPEEILDDLEELDIDIEVVFNEPMLDNDPENPYIQQLKSSAGDVVGDCALERKEPGSDMRFLAAEGIPAVVFGPEGYNSHADDEYAAVESFGDYYEILKRFLRQR
ncbi:MAG: M20 family metallopeptidase [Candidatus Nanohaloarchaea archaeon]